MERQELINLSGQVVNGIMSADESFWLKLIDRKVNKKNVADTAVDIAYHILESIGNILENKK